MRVLQVIARMNVGGTARYVGRLGLSLPDHGIDTLVATGHVQGAEAEDPVVEQLTLARIPRLGRALDVANDLRARRELHDLIGDYRPDVIHTHTFKAGLLGRLLPHHTPLVHTFHGHLFDDPDFAGPKAKVIAAIERGLAPRANRIVTVGARVAEDLLAAGVGRRSQYLSIAPGVDALYLPPKAVARATLGLPADALVVAWLARVTEVKAPHRVLELARRFPDVLFLMGGGGNLLDAMRAAAPGNVRVLGWADAATVYAAADLALSTSTNEGMPVSLIEAQMAGLPVVATDVGGVTEVVATEETGFVVQPEGLAEALSRLIDAPALRDHMGTEANTRAHRLFSPGAMIDAHVALYSDLYQSVHSR